MNAGGLVYIGKVVEISSIEDADYLELATVICGPGGKWKGVIKKTHFEVGSKCLVYLPDSLVPANDEQMAFLKAYNFRIKMHRFRGAPSEALIRRCDLDLGVGTDVTDLMGVTRYLKPVPANLNGKVLGDFPSFIPKTDEPNYQASEQQIEDLEGLAYYVTEKADGASTTAYNLKGMFGLCSRNWELVKNERNGYWQVAVKYDLENKLPEGIALQYETVGPNIQSNPMGFTELDALAFSAYDIQAKEYLPMYEFMHLCEHLKFPMAKCIQMQPAFSKEMLTTLGEGVYENGSPREGVVVRSQHNVYGHKPISFKVLNLSYSH